MKVAQFLVLTVPIAAAALLAVGTVSAKEAKGLAWKDGHAHGFVGCLTQESTSPGYFDLVAAKTDDGAEVGTLRLTGHFLGIGNPQDALNKRVHVTGVYLGHKPTDPGSGSIMITDDAYLVEGECP